MCERAIGARKKVWLNRIIAERFGLKRKIFTDLSVTFSNELSSQSAFCQVQILSAIRLQHLKTFYCERVIITVNSMNREKIHAFFFALNRGGATAFR